MMHEFDLRYYSRVEPTSQCEGSFDKSQQHMRLLAGFVYLRTAYVLTSRTKPRLHDTTEGAGGSFGVLCMRAFKLDRA